jgi:branched-chain amino acid transport system substrate-binding protein
MRPAKSLRFVLSVSSGIRSVLAHPHILLGILLVAASFSAIPVTAQADKPAKEPYATIDRDAIDYRGPGRDTAHDLPGPEIKIGMIVPLQGPCKTEGAALVQAARLGIEDEAGSPLPGGRRLALVPRDQSGPWGLASSKIVELVIEERVLAVVTSTSGIMAHLAEQVGNRLGVPILTLSSDAGTTQTNIPWIFRLGPDDTTQAEAFAKDMYSERHFKQVLLVTEDDRDGRLGTEAFRKAARHWGGPLPDRVQISSTPPGIQPMLAHLNAVNPEAVVVWAASDLGARVVEEIHHVNSTVPIYLCQKAAAAVAERQGVDQRTETTEQEEHGGSAQVGGVWVVVGRQAGNHSGGKEFERRYLERTGNSPSIAAMQAYDAIRLMAAALRQSGPNRARLRDRLARLKNFSGVSGTISFDRAGNDLAAVALARLR